MNCKVAKITKNDVHFKMSSKRMYYFNKKQYFYNVLIKCNEYSPFFYAR